MDLAQIKPRVLEGEIVGHEAPKPLRRRLAERLSLVLVLSATGLVCLVLGAVLTLSIVGAPIGIPILLIGACLLLGAFFSLFGAGTVAVRRL